VFGRTPKAVVGLDIGSSAVKAVELKPSGKGYKVAAFASEAVPADSIVDGAIIDADAVVGTIKRLFDKTPAFKTKKVCASLSGNTVIVKKITLPVMTEAELRDSIYWEAEQYIPFDIQDVSIDYEVIDGGGSGGNMDVLLVAVKKDKISDYTSAITQAGKAPAIVDVDVFALQNAYEINYGTDPGRVIALLNVGASIMNINIIKGGTSIFNRDIAVGGNQYTDAIQKDLNLSFEQAESLKKGGRVEVRVMRQPGGGAAIIVTDTGIGIDPAELPRIFDRFFRGSRASEARGSGSGLGLSIVRSIVEMHGGGVSVESRVGAGTTFRVTLPDQPRVTAGDGSNGSVRSTAVATKRA